MLAKRIGQAFLIMSLFFQFQPAQAGWLKDFCARHLVAEHPYQVWVKRLSTPNLVNEYRHQGGLHQWRRGDPDEYEMILSVLHDRFGQTPPAERQPLRDAIQDYPDPRLMELLSTDDSP